MKCNRLLFSESFTIRELCNDEARVADDAWETVRKTLEYAINRLRIDCHLFVTVLASEVFQGEDDIGFAAYDPGLFHLLVCAGDPTGEMGEDREHWLSELAVSTAHEVVHAWQDCAGRLEGHDEEEYEREAETVAYQIVNEMESDKIQNQAQNCKVGDGL